MKETDWIAIGITLVAGYYIYKTFIAPNSELAKSSVIKQADSYRYPTETDLKRGWTASKSEVITTKGNTTYFWDKESLESLGIVKRALINMGLPIEQVLKI